MTDQEKLSSLNLSDEFFEFIRAHEPAYPFFESDDDDIDEVLCSNCFSDAGLRIECNNLGVRSSTVCQKCKSPDGIKLTSKQARVLAYRYYTLGTVVKLDYGAAPRIAFNEFQKTDDSLRQILGEDAEIFEEVLGIGFFEYGPNLWMVGEVEPLKDLTRKRFRGHVIQQLIDEYPSEVLGPNQHFFRIRINPRSPDDEVQYDSPPEHIKTDGRFDSKGLSIMYASPDIQTCLHECRAEVGDEIYLATLAATEELILLNLCHIPDEVSTPFESVDLALHYIFSAGSHSYEITRSIAKKAQESGYDGIIVPSHFSSLRTGAPSFQTLLGLSVRQIPEMKNEQETYTIPNIILFGHPIREEKIEVTSINRVHLERASYMLRFAPLINERFDATDD